MSGHKILVIRGGALGDFILTLPVLAALRDRFAGCSLEILGYPHIATLAVAAGLASGVHALESPNLTGFFVNHGSWPASSAAFFAQFDLIVSYLYDTDGLFQQNVARVTAARFLAAPHRPDETSISHATEFFLKPLAALGIAGADSCPRINLPASAPWSADPWIAVHPGSGSDRKNWPEDKWAGLLPRLCRHRKWNFFLINGEAEGGRGQRMSALLPASRVCLADNLPLLELARKLKSCAAYLGHDSGITHLAAALGLPGLVLWGPSSAAIWRPRSEKMRLLSQNNLTAKQIEEGLRAMSSLG